MSDPKFWIALSDAPDIGPVTARKLLAIYRKPEAVFKTSYKELSNIHGIGPAKAKSIKGYSEWEKIDAWLKKLDAAGIKIVTFSDKDYPEALKNIEDAPVVLYVKGRIQKEDRYAVAVVGSRNYSPYGKLAAEKLSSELSSMGFTIVSGMARGIDTLAHAAAIKSGGRSIAVLGSGIDVPYPPENRGLMEKLAESGYVISEFPPGAPPDKENFPKRNRIISGLSLGVLVVEAAANSGSLITAGCALEQGKEIFAVPGNINSATSKGTNELLKKGAKLVQSAEDIIEELAPVLKGYIRTREKADIELTVEEKKLCDIMTAEPKHVDILLRESRMPAQTALGILLCLELKGIVKQTEGKKFFLA
ncbi:MAG: DNA-protecting protein DprA [Nitrospirae bacterium CG_4_10_14_3_um_filter_44_29]|nr:DNA-protecting protein DprA [Nitrospirota bacterium]OIO28949.1 MAG: DNA protecting protein DprA [Nitrospirae bacterium CG1_02_44_142]PIP71154.1 MAG: DNA-protecting protein DprA [Nitrospirae bacterium CG22_combo_CG10-13_8_21_14_all_44_11]PIV41386.1 MAG: DNA-protecting protein DprA [Nitrospirae bacterium CG02_land_8_20_14_3_00_44_33]PIV66014.1 MAG: DNA-protecting protein DprA [Nitrospirae bacterium CG01_land_8_20_14_3_00_44_22]PIW88629.1 MAG: DNA-protecting protein DprA [Nitrospirae bacterium